MVITATNDEEIDSFGFVFKKDRGEDFVKIKYVVIS